MRSGADDEALLLLLLPGAGLAVDCRITVCTWAACGSTGRAELLTAFTALVGLGVSLPPASMIGRVAVELVGLERPWTSPASGQPQLVCWC